jgi:hypothetical protein
MRNFLFILFMSMVSVGSFAQKEVTVKAGTLISLQAVNNVRAADVNVGDKVSFRVSHDVIVNGLTAIPYGTVVSGRVTQAKRSSWWGTKGRLGISITDLVMPNGTLVPLQNANIQINGENRTALSAVLFALVVWPACFICGGKAEMQSGYEIQANVAGNTNIQVE